MKEPDEAPKKGRKKKGKAAGGEKEHKTPWDHRNDYIMEMSLSVSVKGEVEEQMLFYEYLKKWLVAMQIVSANISQKLSSVHLGRALCDLGFRRVKYQGVRGYIVVCRKADEMQMVQRSMAREASPDGWTEDSNGQ